MPFSPCPELSQQPEPQQVSQRHWGRVRRIQPWSLEKTNHLCWRSLLLCGGQDTAVSPTSPVTISRSACAGRRKGGWVGWFWEPAGCRGAAEGLPPGQQVSLAVLASPSFHSTPSVLLRELVSLDRGPHNLRPPPPCSARGSLGNSVMLAGNGDARTLFPLSFRAGFHIPERSELSHST